MRDQAKQKYRYTFKCSDHGVFNKISTKANLDSAKCPDCRKEEKESNITKFHRMGDGPVSELDLKPPVFSKAPNVVFQCEGCENKIRLYQQPEAENPKECPNCGSDAIKFICYLDTGITRSGSIQNKAIDETAKICMEDYGLTNLKDNVRMGDTIAPKLPPAQQAKADGFFNGPKSSSGGRRAQMMQGVMRNMGKRAIKGAYRPDGSKYNPNVVKSVHQDQVGLKAHVITAGDNRI